MPLQEALGAKAAAELALLQAQQANSAMQLKYHQVPEQLHAALPFWTVCFHIRLSHRRYQPHLHHWPIATHFFTTSHASASVSTYYARYDATIACIRVY